MKKILCFVWLLLPCLIFGLIRTVKQDGSGDYDAIQLALNACSPGDTVLVYPGLYFGILTVTTDDISLISQEAVTGDPAYVDSTIIDAAQQGSALRIEQDVSNAYIRGFSLTNATGPGIMVYESSARLVNCKVFDCYSSNGAGVYICGSTVFLSGLEIFANRAYISGGGLYTYEPNNIENHITFDQDNRCSIYNNRARSGQDICINLASGDLTIYLDMFSVATPTSYYAILNPSGLEPLDLQIDFQSVHHDEIDCDLYVATDGDDANDGLSPSTPLCTISEAIYRIAADSLNQNTVHLLPGVYSQSNSNQIFPIALKSWTKLKGSSWENTQIIGSPHPYIPTGYLGSDIVFYAQSQDWLSISDLDVTTESTDKGLAIACSDGGSLNLRNIRIHDINPDRFGILHLTLSSQYESLWENVILEDDSVYDVSWVTIEGGMSGKMVNCVFRDAVQTLQSQFNSAPSLIYIVGDDHLSFENCTFCNLAVNTCSTRVINIAGVHAPQQNSSFSFKNCMFSNLYSSSTIMSLASRNDPSIVFTNCTFGGSISGSPSLSLRGNADITNCILYNNSSVQISIFSSSSEDQVHTLNIDYSLIKGGLNGLSQSTDAIIVYNPTNYNLDPLFRGGADYLDPLYYSLAADSPCINSGTPDTLGLFLPAYDLAGNLRVWSNRIDLGCYEYGSQSGSANHDHTTPALSEYSFTAYPNPFRMSTRFDISFPQDWTSGKKNDDVCLVIYNIRGQMIRRIELDQELIDEQIAVWDGRDDRHKECSSGIYFANLEHVGRTVFSRKLTLIRQ